MVLKPPEKPIYRRKNLWTVAESIWGNSHILNPMERIKNKAFHMKDNLPVNQPETFQ